MLQFVSIARKLLKVADEIPQGRPIVAGYKEVEVIRHEAVRVKKECISGAGAAKAIESCVDDVSFSECQRSAACDQGQAVGKWPDIVEVFESRRFTKSCHVLRAEPKPCSYLTNPNRRKLSST